MARTLTSSPQKSLSKWLPSVRPAIARRTPIRSKAVLGLFDLVIGLFIDLDHVGRPIWALVFMRRYAARISLAFSGPIIIDVRGAIRFRAVQGIPIFGVTPDHGSK